MNISDIPCYKHTQPSMEKLKTADGWIKSQKRKNMAPSRVEGDGGGLRSN